MQGVRIMFLGCGFLTTHLLPVLLPHATKIILVDRERVEKENYENSIYPKEYIGRRKVSAVAAFIQLLSSIPVTPMPINIRKVEQLMEIHDKYKPEFVFVTFDNIESRIIARDYALKVGVPALFIGVTEDYVYIDWATHVILPEKEEEKERVKKEMKIIRDVCSRIEFRGLGVIAAAYGYYAFKRYIQYREKNAFIISAKNGISACLLKRP